MSQADIAHACSGTNNSLYELLMIKFVYPNSEHSAKRRQSVENAILEIVDDPANVEKAISAFLSNNICPKCHGTGQWKRPNRAVVECRPCGGFGVVEFKLTGEAVEIHRQLSDAENLALERMARRLSDH
ncbi:hypothetical protein [Allohahella sp. A8]|uniref:hypothetical protein n=1 Tax=Allohahella sp. A8 TaxID=3141461 RepID=UPI003A8007C7